MYDKDKAASASASFITLAVNTYDVKLRAFITDVTLGNDISLISLALPVDKPGSFSIDYNVHKKVLALIKRWLYLER
ncbi:hypothetical protein L1887_05254 [Cichorium endivia]|nr:hypothetical protein L1887_05254 [Cichorium endivia]